MSLTFVTRKLKTQHLSNRDADAETTSNQEAAETDQQKYKTQQSTRERPRRRKPGPRESDIDANHSDSDSGTESDDDEEADTETDGDLKSKVILRPRPNRSDMESRSPPRSRSPKVPSSFAAAIVPVVVSEDNYSSEEELKEIISSDKNKNEAGKKKAKTSSGSGSNNAEKRKWSEVNSSEEIETDEDETGTASKNGGRYVRSSAGNTTTSSSCSNEEEGCNCGRLPTTPVQFCTSPPMDAHRPRRKPWTPPPPKLFHIMSNVNGGETASYSNGCKDTENIIRPGAAFLPVNTGNESNLSVAAASANGRDYGGGASSGVTGVTSAPANNISQYCPRHHHHTQQQQQQQDRQEPGDSAPPRHTPSPSKRHRLTPRPHNIQRPCLDFEKMQQIKKRVVTSWRPQGAELSLFCW